jgi:hypothetical protein
MLRPFPSLRLALSWRLLLIFSGFTNGEEGLQHTIQELGMQATKNMSC